MRMDWIKKIQTKQGLTNYGLAKALRNIGVEITTQGIDAYMKPEARSMRLDVLMGLFKLSQLSKDEFMNLILKEFS